MPVASRAPFLNAVVLLGVVAVSATARAEEASTEPRTLHWNAAPASPGADTESVAAEHRDVDAAGAVDDAQLNPFTLGAPVARGTASVKALGGYDSTTRAGRAISAVDATVTRFLALRVEYEHGPATGTMDRVRVGARVQLFRESVHGIDGGFGFFYDAKDFRNEGNIIGALLVGRHFGRLNLYGNALFGMDTEGDDQAAELRVGTGYRLGPVVSVGFDSRGRLNMSTDAKRTDARAIGWELQATPFAAFSLGPIALLASVGPSVLSATEPGSTKSQVSSGVLAMGGAGGAF